ncbi:MAG: peptidoglycan binding domain-containing protein, partial [Selenomonadaceae bacterium]|nr:peptidoglycan binding domain-containing protein [Selenomonadaceae bacterium]
MDSSMSTGKIAIIAAAAFSALIMVAGVVSLSAANKDRVVIGVQAMGSSISGMKKSDAEHFFEKAGADRISKMPIVLEYSGKTWTIKPEDIHLKANAEDAVENAYSIGRGGSFLQNLLSQMKYAVTGCNVELTADYDRQLLAAKLQEVASAIDAQPVNAAMDFQADGSLRRIPGAIGKKLNTAPIAEALEPQLVSLKHIKTIALEPEEIQPSVTDAD